MSYPTYYAHTLEGHGPEDWQTLEDHLRNVAERSSAFASEFGYGAWGYALGLLHDAGKVDARFQQKLFGRRRESFDHAILGASIARDIYKEAGHSFYCNIMPFPIAGHHRGMPNGISCGEKSQLEPLRTRLRGDAVSVDVEEAYDRLLRAEGLNVPNTNDLEEYPIAQMPYEKEELPRRTYATQLLTRMLYSCLVDADYLDTEEFMTPEVAVERQAVHHDSLGRLVERLDAHMEQLSAHAPATAVNAARAKVLSLCVEAAEKKPGLFSLTVPTGGGKTLASLSFALHHAVANDMKRVIYAIPFTSIVEQTSDVFRGVLGSRNVLEHHSNFDYDALDEKTHMRVRLAAQNWDAPVIATTNVQLLESLYSNRPSKCRKLHNIAHSVIVLDEAQSLPDKLLLPTLALLEELVRDFGVSIVLCTATQPEFDEHWPFKSTVEEIVPRQKELRAALGGRSELVNDGKLSERDLVESLSAAHQCLCVVGTKPKARVLYQDMVNRARGRGLLDEKMPFSEGFYHLSANMTPFHRSVMLEDIRRRLANDERCVVISTQLIEAGVDVDFPEAYRELAGIDSLVQVAGRCNREGRRAIGLVHVFEFPEDEDAFDTYGKPKTLVGNWLENMKEITRSVANKHGGRLSSDMVGEFFRERYGDEKCLDEKGLLDDLCDKNKLVFPRFKTLDFERYADAYQIIDNDDVPVFVPWGEKGLRLLAELKAICADGKLPASMAAKLQRSSVNVHRYRLPDLKKAGFIDDKTFAPINVLSLDQDCEKYYSDEVGLLGPGGEEMNDLII